MREEEAEMGRADRWAFIVNPIAGNGYGASCAGTADAMMKAHGADGEVVLTRAKGHATELAASFASRGFTRIVAVGGDGTASETAAPLVGMTGLAFGVVGAGTGNDFIHILGFPDRFEKEDWDALFECTTARMDVGRCNGKYFFNGMGLGFDAQVAYENYKMNNGGGVKKGSKAKYTWHIVKTIFTYREIPMRISLDGNAEDRKCFLNTISIGRRIAAGLFLTPKAIADDGLLDVCLMDPLSVPGRLKELISVQKGTHLQDKPTHYRQASRITAEFEREVPAHLDGEITSAKKFQIDVLAKALNVIINPRGDHYFLRPGPGGTGSA